MTTDYRLLNVGEVIREGDEWFFIARGRWAAIEPGDFGNIVDEDDQPIRRRTTLRDELAEQAKPVATLCLTPAYYAHGNIATVELQIEPGATLERGTRLYTHPAPPSALVEALRGLDRRLICGWQWIKADELNAILAAQQEKGNG